MFRRKKLWIIPVIVAIVAGTCVLTMPRLVAGATEEDKSETVNEPIPTVFARVHGELIPLTEGMVLDATDGCETLAKGSKYWNYNKVTMERISDGWLVTEVTWKHLKASPAPPKLPEGGKSKKAPVPKVKSLKRV
jgi:hypothetical protein